MARLGYPSPSPQGKIGHRRSVLWVSPDRVCRGEALEVMYESASTDCGYGGRHSRGGVWRASHLIYFEWGASRGEGRSSGDDGVRWPERRPVAEQGPPPASHPP